MVWLNKAYQARFNPSVLLRPAFDPLRSDARFQDLLYRIGLPTDPAPGRGVGAAILSSSWLLGQAATLQSERWEHRPQWSDGFQAHVAGALDGPFVVLLQQQRTDQAGDGGFVGEDADDLAASLDLAIQSFQRVGNWYEDLGAHSFGWDRLGSGVWCDHPGRGAPGAR